MLITFEGGEGVGKTTQIDLLYQRLVKEGREVRKLREPGGTPVGEKIRNILLSSSNNMVPECELLLYEASRVQLMEELIRPETEGGKIILCDRFYDATLAYQGYARGLDIGFIKKLNAFATRSSRPDLTFLLDMPVEKAVGRARTREGEQGSGQDRFERESDEFHVRVREGYLKIWEENGDRIVRLDASVAVPDLHEKIYSVVEKKLYEN